jgi:hypothetical protein
MEQKKCAPSKKFSDGSCFTYDILQSIAKKYNEKYNDNINLKLPKSELVKILEDKLNTSKCNNQTCWLKTDLIKEFKLLDEEIYDDIYNNTFRPIGPKNKFAWLSNVNINEIIEQYQDKYNDFLYLGAVPYDFEELDWLGFKNMDFNQLYKDGKHKLGLIINLDTHDKSGSHWVALFINLDKYQLYYFDSFGTKPGKKIRRFNNKIFNFFKKRKGITFNNNIFFNNKKLSPEEKEIYENISTFFDIRYNKIQHQQKNSECGVYSTNFILRLIKGETFDEITKNITRDPEMNECRSTYFRNLE